MARSDKVAPPSFDAWPEHPLFPVDEGERPPEVAYIQITRIDSGQQYWGPVLRADELTTTEELFEMYGGGHYELWARGHSKNQADRPGNVTKRKRFMLAGRSKPMSKDPTPEEIRRSEGTTRSAGEFASPAAAAAPSSSAPGENMLLALLTMQQNQATQAAESARSFMALMMQMITDSKKESVQQMQQMTTLMMTLTQGQQQSMMGLFTALLQKQGGGAEEMARYADLLRKLGVGSAKTDETKEEPAGFGKMLEDAADFVQGVVALKGAAPIVANGTPATPPLPGTAAAVAAEIAPK